VGTEQSSEYILLNDIATEKKVEEDKEDKEDKNNNQDKEDKNNNQDKEMEDVIADLMRQKEELRYKIDRFDKMSFVVVAVLCPLLILIVSTTYYSKVLE